MGQKQRKRKTRQAGSKGGRIEPAAAGVPGAPPALLSLTVVGVSLGIVLVVAMVYAQVRQFNFVYLDDPVYVENNSWVLKGLSWEGFKWSLTTYAAGNWHPLTWLSHMADIDMYGKRAGGHHVTSVVIHAVNSVLLFIAFLRMTSRTWESAMVAALFAVHPLHVESVAWVSERKDVLSALFWILTIHAYISYVRHRSVWRYLLVMLLFALGLMSKPMVVTLPFALLLLDYWPLKRLSLEAARSVSAWLALVKEKTPLFILMIGSMAATMKAQRGYGAVVKLEEFPLKARITNSIVAYTAYIGDLLWPAGLAAFYPFQPHTAAYVATAAILLISFTVFALLQARRRPYVLVGWAWYVGTLIPVIGLVQVGDQSRADRYTYIPAIGLFLIAVWWLSEIAPRRGFRRILLSLCAVLTISACTVLSAKQASYWRDNISLFSRAIDVTTRNYRSHALLGVALSADGKHEEAISQYKASLRIWVGNAEVHTNMGSSLFALGKNDQALHEFSEAVRYKPDNALYHYNYGVMLFEVGRLQDGLRQVRIATELDPANKQYREALGTLTAKTKG